MEHRWGERVAVDIPVRLTTRRFSVRAARLYDVSLSGAFIKGTVDLRILSRVQLVIEMPLRFRHATPVLAAYVTRKLKEGFGVEWCEFAPQAIVELIRAVPHHRRALHDIEAAPKAAAPAQPSAPLLKHGT